MFRTQQNAFDDVVAKATDENLTSENWEYILDVCDKVQGNESGGKDVVAAMIKRLAHRNANVQLYTLELANALSQNCGIIIHRELASRSFTDSMLRLAGDRTTHQQVKAKILERMEEWSRMFNKNPELGIMDQAYQRLKSQNPNLQPPQAPVKKQITEYDRQKEEEELQMALKLSIQDNSTQAKSKPVELSAQTSNSAATTSSTTNSAPQPVPSGTTAATVSRVRALYDFVPSEPGELQFRKGDVIAVLESVYKDWWKGSLRGQTGIFPLNYVEKLSDPTPEELQKEAQTEAEVFGQIKNVERLLALLSTNTGDVNPRDNDEITELYHDTLAIRPKLIELIAKYTQKKDDFQQLNEKFIKARRDYEALLETSMAHSAQQYGRLSTQPYGYNASHPGYPPPQQRYYGAEGQPPNPNAVPAHYQAQQPPQGFQPPYPTATPTPQPNAQVPGYPANFAPARRQSYHSDVQGQHPGAPPQEMATSVYDTPSESQPHRQPSYPSGQPDNKDYYASSVYSQESQYPPQGTEHHPQSQMSSAYPPTQAQPLQQQQSGYSSHQQQQPPYAPQQAYPPQAPAPDRQTTTSPYQAYPPTNQAGGVPPPQQYQAYQPPQAAGAGAPANFYR